MATTRTLTVGHFASGEEFRDYFKRNYGPTIAVYRNIADDPDRIAALDDDLAALGERHLAGSAAGMEWEYLLLITHKRA